eukprot:CAMPEP_0182446454 /NCGR_PEP_ID=MMETSP1172-20130603/4213_1 /TAXON_ID=708627 /ORGANISM="Timspurckia oligopyrenoides, Strain CCMP3278" /LENGTH=259 /DNA_ID=CAMNT_0024642387 /DNA_START=71 /DNA_END=847 /DNA_ORIENTATION=+
MKLGSSGIELESVHVLLKDQLTSSRSNVIFDSYISDISVPISDEFQVGQKASLEVSMELTKDKVPFYPHQVFVRVRDLETKESLVYIGQRSKDKVVVKINFKDESKLNSQEDSFWKHNGDYSMSVILGDKAMGSDGIIKWELLNQLKLVIRGGKRTASSTPGVFDFDLSAKRTLLPEFLWEKPSAEKRAPIAIVIVFCILVTLPSVGFIVVMSRMSVFPLTIPASGSSRLAVFGFFGCVALYILVLTLFWLGWTILSTW